MQNVAISSCCFVTFCKQRRRNEQRIITHAYTAIVLVAVAVEVCLIGSLSKPRRRRHRERHQTKGLMSKTIAVHVRYKFLYISLRSSAKQQR